MRQRVARPVPEGGPPVRAVLHRFNETLEHPVPGMAELVEELYARQVPLYAITNFSADLWPPFRNTQPVFDRFRDIVVSGVERMVKPDAAIYHLRSEERRVGKECVSTCRSRWSP